MDQSPEVFLSYASPDRDRVDRFYQYLKAEGFNPWLDKYEIRGGQNWDFEIKKALKRAAIIVVFLSSNSVNKRGYCQKEIKIVFDKAQEKLVQDIYIIPIALDPDLIFPAEIEHVHVIMADKVDAFSELSRSILGQLDELGEHRANAEHSTGLSWRVETLTERWDGLPGFEFKYDLLTLSSTKYPEISRITEIMRGDAAERLLVERRTKFNQSPEFFNFGQDRFWRQNAIEFSCHAPIITGRVLSVVQELYWHYAGAAHPNHGFKTMNFTVDPLVCLDEISEIFDDSIEAFKFIQSRVRQLLSAVQYEGQQLLDDEWLKRGTAEWENLQNYAFTAEGLRIFFAPYQVGSYAEGSHSVVVPYAEIAKLMKREIFAALGL